MHNYKIFASLTLLDNSKYFQSGYANYNSLSMILLALNFIRFVDSFCQSEEHALIYFIL